MAFKRPFLAEDLNCPVCGEMFKDPVILICSHSACKDCLTKFWEGKGTRECPICRKRSSDDPPLLNLILKNLCRAFLQERNQRALFCSQHKRQLELYCQEDKEAVCLVCRDSEKHKNHNFSPIGEIASGFRDDIIARLHSQENNLKEIEDFKLLCDKMADHIKRQAVGTETHIKEEFEKLHQYLREQEATRIADLKSDEKDKSQWMTEKIEKACRDAADLRKTITETEEDLATDDASLILNYQRIVDRTGFKRWPSDVSQLDLIDVAKHTGNLMFNVWEKMAIPYFPVLFDPNTAHPELSVSARLSGAVRTAALQPVPPHPDRFLHTVSVLGCEGFTSGVHCWDVNVFNKRHWLLGVASESYVNRVRSNDFSQPGCCFLLKDYGDYAAGVAPKREVAVRVEDIPFVIRVRLDMDRGKVTFSDPQTRKHLRSFKHGFSEKVFPYFATLCGREPLQILPLSNTVTVQKPK